MPVGGAASFHLMWRLPTPARDARLVEVSAVVEIVNPPRVPALYFWALQVDFADARGVWAGAHTGLQWNRRYPGSTAVNWGGYASAERGGAVLPGTRSHLPGFVDDPNTLSYEWTPGREYRLRISSSPEIRGAWRAEVTDLLTGLSTTVRDLLPRPTLRSGGGLLRRLVSPGAQSPGDAGDAAFLLRPIIWSEVFAECDDPSASVRWSDLQAIDQQGRTLRPEAVVANYQSEAEGGCYNTDSSLDDEGGLLQTTNTRRLTSQGTVVRLP